MSRHLYDCKWNDQPIQVVVGYDRPLKNFFLHIAWLNESTGAPMAYVSELDLAYDPDDLHSIRKFLDKVRISTPEPLWTEVAHDAALNVGNRVVRHLSDGSMIDLLS